MQTGDKEALLDGVPEGATFKQARELILPARTWVDTGMDGIEIYLDAEQNAAEHHRVKRSLERRWQELLSREQQYRSHQGGATAAAAAI